MNSVHFFPWHQILICPWLEMHFPSRLCWCWINTGEIAIPDLSFSPRVENMTNFFPNYTRHCLPSKTVNPPSRRGFPLFMTLPDFIWITCSFSAMQTPPA